MCVFVFVVVVSFVLFFCLMFLVGSVFSSLRCGLLKKKRQTTKGTIAEAMMAC